MSNMPFRKQQPKYQKLSDVIAALNAGKDVSVDEILDTPEMKAASERLSRDEAELRERVPKGLPPVTVNLAKKDRIEIWKQIIQDLDRDVKSARYVGGKFKDYHGEVKTEKKMDIVIGLPASGKSSSVVDKLSAIRNARVIDNDEVKKRMPEFDLGYGAGLVHTESQLISDKQMTESLKRGENVIVAKVGGDVEGIMDIAKAAKAYGYKEINVHYVELDRKKALARMLGRFISQNRFLHPSLIFKYDDGKTNHIEETYRELKKQAIRALKGERKEDDLITGYSRWDNDVEIGKEPRLLEARNLYDIGIPDRTTKENDRGIQGVFDSVVNKEAQSLWSNIRLATVSDRTAVDIDKGKVIVKRLYSDVTLRAEIDPILKQISVFRGDMPINMTRQNEAKEALGDKGFNFMMDICDVCSGRKTMTRELQAQSLSH